MQIEIIFQYLYSIFLPTIFVFLEWIWNSCIFYYENGQVIFIFFFGHFSY